MKSPDITRKFVFLGEYPQTLKSDNVKSTNCVDGYWIGNDGERYIKAAAKLTVGMGLPTPFFSNGNIVVNDQEYFFKVEPIKWMVLNEDDETELLLCDKVINSMQFCNITYDCEDNFFNPAQINTKFKIRVIGYDKGCVIVERRDPISNGIAIRTERYHYIDDISHRIHDNNYQFSDIRKWLNTQFYSLAFNELEKQKILTVEVDNSAEMSEPFKTKSWNDVQKQAFNRHMGNPYNADDKDSFSCENTNDKVFLVSVKELTDVNYGFSSAYGRGKNPIIELSKKVSDYGIANGAWVSEAHPNGCGWWWLRSPNLSRADIVHMVRFDGRIYSDEFYPSDQFGGVVPAIKINKKKLL